MECVYDTGSDGRRRPPYTTTDTTTASATPKQPPSTASAAGDDDLDDLVFRIRTAEETELPGVVQQLRERDVKPFLLLPPSPQPLLDTLPLREAACLTPDRNGAVRYFGAGSSLQLLHASPLGVRLQGGAGAGVDRLPDGIGWTCVTPDVSFVEELLVNFSFPCFYCLKS
jgi:hypothetical protein